MRCVVGQPSGFFVDTNTAEFSASHLIERDVQQVLFQLRRSQTSHCVNDTAQLRCKRIQRRLATFHQCCYQIVPVVVETVDMEVVEPHRDSQRFVNRFSATIVQFIEQQLGMDQSFTHQSLQLSDVSFLTANKQTSALFAELLA